MTSVGATQMVSNNVVNDQGAEVCQVVESVCSTMTGSGITSGGGFSYRQAQPKWQRDVVEAYLARGTYPSMKFNHGGRGYPDVSVFGHLFQVVQAGDTQVVDGTSASAPAFAGMLTLIRDAALQQGANHSGFGFLNPVLYEGAVKGSTVYKDIVSGDNSCQQECCSSGYEAAPGWDPATGLGSVNFIALASLLGVTIPASPSPPVFPSSTDCGKPEIKPVVRGSAIVLPLSLPCTVTHHPIMAQTLL